MHFNVIKQNGKKKNMKKLFDFVKMIINFECITVDVK